MIARIAAITAQQCHCDHMETIHSVIITIIATVITEI